jgi:peptidyl-prolyl cis-trans isomerase A (cyclophilin A)
MSDASRGMPSSGRWLARIETSMGDLTCDLWPDKAPLTVANFIGLARGLRPWKSPEGPWERQPAYDGTSFHRVIPNFAIQGGSPTGRADWQPGYVIPDEIWDGANHDRAGQLCMVTTAKHSGGMQLFITDGPAPQLDGSYPIFGSCGPVQLVHAIAGVEARRGRPVAPVRIETIRITRRSTARQAPNATATAAP